MRALLTSLLALALSGLAGGLVVQAIAVATLATEEFILAFIFVPLFALLVAAIFLVAQLAGARAGVDRVGRWLLVLCGAAIAGLFAFEFWADAGNLELVRKALPLLGALTLAAITVLLVQWLFTRWRASRGAPPVAFGRAGGSA